MTTVTLNISRTAQTGYTLATDIKPHTERTYYYQYTGGNTSNNNGDVETNTGTPIDFTVSLGTPASSYEIKKVNFIGNANNDGSANVASSKQSATINDRAQHKGEITYCLKIEDIGDPNGRCTFDCDPKIINQ